MAGTMPDPKVIIDSIADGAVELAEGPVRVAQNTAVVATNFANGIKANMEDLKSRMPEDPAVIIDCVVKGAGQTVDAGLSAFEGFGDAIMDTFSAVKTQIKRVTG